MTPRFVYPQLVEAVFHRTLRTRMDDGARARLRALGIDVDAAPDLMPGGVFHAGLRLAAAAAFPELTAEAAERRTGALACRVYAELDAGRMILAPAGTFGPIGVLADAAAYFQTGMNYFDVSSTVVSPTRVVVRIRPLDEGKEFWGGVLEQVAKLGGAVGVTVELEAAGREARYTVSWSGVSPPRAE
jgi:uncharacterized protein (TIGR02265 family)